MKKLWSILGSTVLLGLIFIGLNQSAIFAEEVELPEPVEECEGPHERAEQRLEELGLKQMLQKGQQAREQEGLGPMVRQMARQHRQE